MPESLIEPIGLLATLVILISLAQSNTKRLRILNAIGSVLFVIYGLFKGAWSVWILNGICFFVNLYKLYKMRQELK